MKHSVQRNGFVIPEGKILRCAQDDRGGAYNVSPEDVEADMYYVYMISNWNNRVLYTGMTNNLERRVYEHKNHLVKGFTSRYNVHKLVYFDSTEDVKRAIEREKQIKGWTRAKKDALVEQANPGWHDLSADWNM